MTMRIKPTLELDPSEFSRSSSAVAPRVQQLNVTPPQVMVTVPAPMPRPRTIWGARRQANYYKALEEVNHAQSAFLRSQAECAKSFVVAARAANEVAEIPEMCANDTEVRRLDRETN